MSKSVLIVGTGLGGLSTGLRLATRGFHVTFVEKFSQPGGRLNQIKKEGFTATKIHELANTLCGLMFQIM